MTTAATVQAISATAADLPRAVAAALAAPTEGIHGMVDAGGVRWPTISWGEKTDPPLLLIHGVTSNAGIWWRVGPALAASGRYVIAVDMPGHGRAGHAPRSHRFVDTARDLVAFVQGANLDRATLAVIGHSWGGMVTAHLPAAGLLPRTLILLDPPFLTLGELDALTKEPSERPYATLEESIDAVRASNPTWSDGDVAAKAQALTEFNQQLVLNVLLKNGDWDAGMAALRDPHASRVDVWLIRGEWDTGGLIPDSKVAAIERKVGAGHVLTIAGGAHSPQRTHPEATILAILRALG